MWAVTHFGFVATDFSPAQLQNADLKVGATLKMGHYLDVGWAVGKVEETIRARFLAPLGMTQGRSALLKNARCQSFSRKRESSVSGIVRVMCQLS